MPRKPGLPLIANMVIEGLSDGREVRAVSFVDDFTGQVMPVVQDTRPVRRLPTPNEMALRRKQIAQAKADLQAQRSAKALKQVLVNMIDPPEHKPFKRRF